MIFGDGEIVGSKSGPSTVTTFEVPDAYLVTRLWGADENYPAKADVYFSDATGFCADMVDGFVRGIHTFRFGSEKYDKARDLIIHRQPIHFQCERWVETVLVRSSRTPCCYYAKHGQSKVTWSDIGEVADDGGGGGVLHSFGTPLSLEECAHPKEIGR